MVDPRIALLALTAVLADGPAWADDGLALLNRIAQVSRSLTYSGTFVYRSGGRVDTSRIVRALSNGVEVEKIEALDGSPREVFRVGSDVKCFFPEEKLLIVESLPMSLFTPETKICMGSGLR